MIEHILRALALLALTYIVKHGTSLSNRLHNDDETLHGAFGLRGQAKQVVIDSHYEA